MQLPPSLLAVLREPTPTAAWVLRGDLLALGVPPESRPIELLGELHRFLDRLATGASSRDLSELASKMDIAALGGVVASDLVEASDSGERARRLLAAALAEGLAVLATRQHVRAWRGELGAVYREAAWYLYGELWRWASQRKPELAPSERRRLLDRLIAPIRGESLDGSQKAMIVGRLFQLLLVDALADAVAPH